MESCVKLNVIGGELYQVECDWWRVVCQVECDWWRVACPVECDWWRVFF